MPSFIIGNASGGDLILSGQLAGAGIRLPRGGIQLRLDSNSSGNAYIALSGGMTVKSGMLSIVSGGVNSGMLDGMLMTPGDAYWIPEIAFPTSGILNVYAQCDSVCSGQARLYFDVW